MPRKPSREYVLVITTQADPVIQTYSTAQELGQGLWKWIEEQITQRYANLAWTGVKAAAAKGDHLAAADRFFDVAGGRWYAYHPQLGRTDAVRKLIEAGPASVAPAAQGMVEGETASIGVANGARVNCGQKSLKTKER